MSQMPIRRPFGELDLCDQLGSTDDDNPGLRFDRWGKQFDLRANVLFSRAESRDLTGDAAVFHGVAGTA